MSGLQIETSFPVGVALESGGSRERSGLVDTSLKPGISFRSQE